MLWTVVLMETTLIEKHAGSTSTKEHLENVVRVELILSELLLISLSKIIFCAMLIINFPLLWVAQAGECSRDLLKSIFSVGSPILVRMKLKCQLSICLFDVIIWGALCNSQYFIVVLLCNDHLTFINVFLRIVRRFLRLLLCELCRICVCRGIRSRFSVLGLILLVWISLFRFDLPQQLRSSRAFGVKSECLI